MSGNNFGAPAVFRIFVLDIRAFPHYNNIDHIEFSQTGERSEMTKTCVAIIIIVFISSYMCMRNGYKTVGRSILPVAMVPAGHIIGTKLILRLMKAGGLIRQPAAVMSVATALDVAACVAGCAIVIAVSRTIFRRNSTRRTYAAALSAFMAVLTLALLINYYDEF